MTPKDRLIVALDVPSTQKALQVINELENMVSIYKIGYQLGYAGGLGLAEWLVKEGKQVFLDFKLHDIGNTVKEGVTSLSHIGASFLTVHAYPQTMRAAIKGRGNSALKLLAVNVLTSYNSEDLAEAGYALSERELIKLRTNQAIGAGMDGIIASAMDIEQIRAIVQPEIELITPGIRPYGCNMDDQKRVMTPGDAIRAGADRIVVGRPIILSDDLKKTTKALLNEIEAAT